MAVLRPDLRVAQKAEKSITRGWPDNDDQPAQPRSRFRLRSVTTTGRLQRTHGTVHSNSCRNSWAIYLSTSLFHLEYSQAGMAGKSQVVIPLPRHGAQLDDSLASHATPPPAQRCPEPVSQSAALSGCVEGKACDRRFCHHPFLYLLLVACAIHLCMLYSS